MSGTDWILVVEVAVFFILTWFAGRVLEKVGVSPILGHIATGVVLGPYGLNAVPFATKDAHGPPSIWVLGGQVGVTLMIMESGMHIDYGKVRQVGTQASVVAVLGTGLPLIFGMLAMTAVGFPMFPDGLAAGVALAPTSVGIALKLLSEAKALNSQFGQSIITAAFGDDVLSLIGLVILLNVASGALTPLSVIWPLVASAAFVAAGVWLSIRVMPRAAMLLQHVGENPSASHQPRDELHLGAMLAALVGCGFVGWLIGSHLLGAFVAGMLFTNVPRSMLVWKRQMKRIAHWLIRLFFAATVAFAIPVSVMLSLSAFWRGLVVAAIGCIGTKVVSGVFAGDNRWVIGWAMVGRGEFAYLVAQTATHTRLTDGRLLLGDKPFSVVVWALLLSTVVAPVAFKHVLARRLRSLRKSRPRSRSSIYGEFGTMPEDGRFRIRVEGHHHTGILHEVCDALHSLGLDVIEAIVESDDDVDVEIFTVRPRGGDDFDLDDEKMMEMKHELLEAVSDPEAQIVFLPIPRQEAQALEIQFMTGHHPDVFADVMQTLEQLHFDVDAAAVHRAADAKTDIDTFFVEPTDETALSKARACEVRDALNDIAHKYSLKSECMVRAVARTAEKRAEWASPQLTACDGVLKISVVGSHSEHSMNDMAASLHDLNLDVLHAAMQRRGAEDVAVFYVSEIGDPGAVDHRRGRIQDAVVALLRKRYTRAHVSVQRVRQSVTGDLEEEDETPTTSPQLMPLDAPPVGDKPNGKSPMPKTSRRHSTGAVSVPKQYYDVLGFRMPAMHLTPLTSPLSGRPIDQAPLPSPARDTRLQTVSESRNPAAAVVVNVDDEGSSVGSSGGPPVTAPSAVAPDTVGRDEPWPQSARIPPPREAGSVSGGSVFSDASVDNDEAGSAAAGGGPCGPPQSRRAGRRHSSPMLSPALSGRRARSGSEASSDVKQSPPRARTESRGSQWSDASAEGRVGVLNARDVDGGMRVEETTEERGVPPRRQFSGKALTTETSSGPSGSARQLGFGMLERMDLDSEANADTPTPAGGNTTRPLLK